MALPWVDSDALIAAAGGTATGTVGRPAGVGPGHMVWGRGPDFANQLWQAGAWLVTGEPRLLKLYGKDG